MKDIAAPFAMSLPAISKHLQILERAGLISRGREAQWRPARLRASALAPAAGWIDDYRKFWDTSFDALEHHLTTEMKGTTSD